jgi:hypothetical protein
LRPFDLDPQAAIAASLRFETMPSTDKTQAFPIEKPVRVRSVVSVVQRRCRRWQQAGKPRLAFDHRLRCEILAVEMEKIEQEEHKCGSVARVRRHLDHAERGNAVGAGAAQFAVPR